MVPAQHYFMGGVKSDLFGRTTMKRLYAVGETCCNGVHGANRLASNSLLESLLFAERAAEDIAANFEAFDEKAAEYAANKLVWSDYKNPGKLMEDYKALLKNKIKEAEDERNKHAN